MGKSGGDSYFDLGSVIESSKLFGYGKVPYRVLGRWHYPASQIYKIRMLGNDTDIVFVKLLNRNEDEICKHQILIENEYNVLKLMYEKCNSAEYGVVEPLECIKSRLALITKGEEGQRLDQILLNIRPFSSVGHSQILGGMVSAGMWLRCLFESTKLLENDYDINKGILDEIDMGVEIIQSYKKSREWILWGKVLISSVSKLVNSIDGTLLKESLCHGDFIPGNILLSKSGKTVVLDLTDSSRGMIYKDLAYFWQWIDELGKRRPWYRGNEIEQMKSHLLKGFFQGEIPSTLVNIFVIKTGIRKISAMVQKRSGPFLGNFMRERRVDYWKRKLLMIAENGCNVVREG
jgi:hypothetical protein